MALVRKYFVQGLIAALVLGFVFAFLGVYNTNAQPLFNRYVFWTSTMIVGIFATGVSAPWVMHRLCPQQHRFLQLFLIAAIISFPVTLVLAAYDHNYGTDWSFYIWFVQYRYVIVISLILMFGGYFILKAQGKIDIEVSSEPETDVKPPPATKDTDSVSAESRFLKRLSSKFHSATLHAVSSEDHYLRVHTNEGSELILMRLSDALRELEQVPGMQTHRSWWVANQAVSERQRDQGKTKLLLKSGLTVPVSRSFEKQIKATDFA